MSEEEYRLNLNQLHVIVYLFSEQSRVDTIPKIMLIDLYKHLAIVTKLTQL